MAAASHTENTRGRIPATNLVIFQTESGSQEQTGLKEKTRGNYTSSAFLKCQHDLPCPLVAPGRGWGWSWRGLKSLWTHAELEPLVKSHSQNKFKTGVEGVGTGQEI